ncbi:HAMP domain-containing sensor histidine kinase [Agrococcus sp. SL85]|uniref:sensor histidine kinase n=1 Tax=Agrococcus sp. SL85 TaxID=2995141 RepID=UPI00226C8C3D|nr:HAMP domain-containing sensor histidine kinase [Agrococcus sp. SL85]WAC66050.1 HAMP domain-containing sensor histidine kinase [Agrococcus sp. SL85]
MSAAPDPDERRVRQAALRVGLWIAAASAAAIAVGVAVLLAAVLGRSRPERHEGGPVPDGDRVVVDVDDLVPVVLLLALAGVVLLAGIAVLAARRAVRPLAEALRGQRAFVSDASHELRTPLTALSSRIQIVERRHARGEPIDEPLGRLRHDAAVMDDVLTDLLLAAEGAGAAERSAAVGAAMREAAALLEPLGEPRGVAIALRDEAGGAEVPLAPATLSRVLVALLDNAIQHAPDGSTVTLAAAIEHDGIVLRVVDRGRGIPEADRERIFERFARSGEHGRRRGFGIGLALVRQAVERAGGDVRVEASSADGTTFRVVLPAAHARR